MAEGLYEFAKGTRDLLTAGIVVNSDADIGVGNTSHGTITLNVTPETVSAAIAIPDGTRLLTLLASDRCRVGFQEAPGGAGTDTVPTAGIWLHPNVPLTLTIPVGVDRTFQVVSGTASTVVYFDFRP